ncbi:MAG: SH3 domain-containing protein [Butyrivibrio sp.]|nr:SH3 domain-containing protein [Butyrivibrio sp.]
MEQLFLYVLNNAITVSALIIAIIVVRAFGKKMPKWIACMLWMIVAIKLVVPVHIESVLSLIPTREPIPSNITMEENPQIASGISSVDGTVNSIILQKIPSDSAASVNPLQIWFYIGGLVWAIGMAVLIVYAVVTYILLRKRVSASVKVAPKVYECDDISDSFILGIIIPRIYLPSTMSDDAKEYILKHEFAHLSRLDYIWKPLGFAILSVYWFNPLCWIAYILLCKDIEYACDEKVTMNIEKDKKAEYCRVLFENSIQRRMIEACPVAFGGNNVKNRIKNVANYKKPAFWITLASLVVCAAVGVCFATSKSSETELTEVQEQIADSEKKEADLQNIFCSEYHNILGSEDEPAGWVITKEADWYKVTASGDVYMNGDTPQDSSKYYEAIALQQIVNDVVKKIESERGGTIDDSEKLVEILNGVKDKGEYGTAYSANKENKVIPSSAPEGDKWVKVADVMTVRKGPSKDDDVIAVIAPYEEMEPIEEVNGWYKVNIDGEWAYVNSDFVK